MEYEPEELLLGWLVDHLLEGSTTCIDLRDLEESRSSYELLKAPGALNNITKGSSNYYALKVVIMFAQSDQFVKNLTDIDIIYLEHKLTLLIERVKAIENELKQ